jgi:hypothetical protein
MAQAHKFCRASLTFPFCATDLKLSVTSAAHYGPGASRARNGINVPQGAGTSGDNGLLRSETAAG